MAMNLFNEFSFRPILVDVIHKLHFQQPTEIQEQAIPAILKGRSIIGQSQTGSGKTHAYLLPLFNEIDEGKSDVQFIITAPTRELAMQIHDKIKEIVHHANKEHEWRSQLLVGGIDKMRANQKLKNPPQIIVGTPGTILDMVDRQVLSIYSATHFVIDEADLMLDMGFIEEIDQLLVRAKQDIQLLVFSATIPKRLAHFMKKYLRNPLFVKVDDSLLPETIEHRLIHLKHRNPTDLIIDLSKIFQPYVAIIFVNGKEEADQTVQTLYQKGLEVGLLHGGLTPRERKRVLKDIENLRYQYVVATDLASRGIDIKGVSHVINAELPKEEDFYIHRVGRTARAGMEGTAISFYTDEDIPLIKKLEQKGIPFIYTDVKDGRWKKAKPWNQRHRRKNVRTHLDQEAWKRIKKPKKVKPGYKKKMKKKHAEMKRKLMKKKSYKK